MKGADGKSLKIIQTIAAHDFITFGMCLLQDENGEEVDLIEKNHISKGADGVTKAILQKWLSSDAPTRTYQYLIECLRQSELGALAERIANTKEGIINNYFMRYYVHMMNQLLRIPAPYSHKLMHSQLTYSPHTCQSLSFSAKASFLAN